jgi:probable rRNA maturation factor
VTISPPLTLELALVPEHSGGDALAEADWQGWFHQWASHLGLEGSPIHTYELSLRLTDDDEIQDLNRIYRHLDQPTDVLSFAALETDSLLPPELLATEPLYLGDIIISLDTAERQAADAGRSLLQETTWLAAHGFLHLLGWDHPDEASLVAMLDQQSQLLSLISAELGCFSK